MKVSLGSGRKSAESLPFSASFEILQVLQNAVFLLIFFTLPAAKAIKIEFLGAEKIKLLDKPNYFKICRRSDKLINQCIKSSLEKFMKIVNSGSSEYPLPSIDPIEIPLLEVRKGSGNVSLEIVFKNLTIYGFNTFKIMAVKSNIIDNKFEISMKASYLDMVSQFTAEGGIFTFPISGQGDFSLNLTDVSTNLIIRLGITRDLSGLDFFTTENVMFSLLPSDVDGHFGNNIDGSNEIGSAFNDFFNRNAHEFFDLIKPQVEDVFAKIAKAIADEILHRHPEKTLLPD